MTFYCLLSIMKTLNLLACFTILFSFAFAAEEMYTAKFDNVDYEEILRSERLLQNYIKCLLELGPCTADARELRYILPDALNSNCSKCSERQKKAAKRIIQYLMDNKQEAWEQLAVKYDPSGNFRANYQTEWLSAK